MNGGSPSNTFSWPLNYYFHLRHNSRSSTIYLSVYLHKRWTPTSCLMLVTDGIERRQFDTTGWSTVRERRLNKLTYINSSTHFSIKYLSTWRCHSANVQSGKLLNSPYFWSISTQLFVLWRHARTRLEVATHIDERIGIQTYQVQRSKVVIY